MPGIKHDYSMHTQLHKTRLASLLLGAGAAALLTFNATAGLKAGDPLPDLAKSKLEGKLPEDLKGKVVLLDFWASWCEPCKASFPVMADLQKKYGPAGLVIVAINVDENRS